MIDYFDFKNQLFGDVEQCRRIFHGRGSAYEGLEHVVVDWLPPAALIRLYKEESAAWLLSMAQILERNLPGCTSVQVQYRCRARAPIEIVSGEELSELVVDECGLKFHLQLGRSQNIGLFLDMRNARHWVKETATGKNVLNLFAYTCAFSVAAMAGGAKQVVNVDLSKASLSRGRENHRLNSQDTSKVIFQGVDIFKSFSRIKKHAPYDLLICDPPNLQKGSVNAERDYKKILRRVSEWMSPGGQLMLCLNSHRLDEAFLHEMVAEYCPGFRFVEVIKPPEVFVDAVEESGLKVLVFEGGLT
ncbi:MAG: class I SAM-dependent methyltransferase [Gammaproteobacteria bacterium]|nr:class I SAM-dependent methyltransferase [Gammaproteobacteria bacterium]